MSNDISDMTILSFTLKLGRQKLDTYFWEFYMFYIDMTRLYFGLSESLMTAWVCYMSFVSPVTTGLNVIQVFWIRKQMAEVIIKITRREIFWRKKCYRYSNVFFLKWCNNKQTTDILIHTSIKCRTFFISKSTFYKLVIIIMVCL